MPRPKSWVIFLLAAVPLVFGPGCARRKMNARDANKEQMRQTAQAKRQELQPAAGHYRGLLRQGEMTQDISLDLEVKDVSNGGTGEVDPVLVPTLAGSMRLTFGHLDGGEFYAFGVQKADFDSKRQKVDLVVTNQQLKEIVISLDRGSDGDLRGSWTAPGLSATGDIELKKTSELNLQGTNLELRGEYNGYLTWAGKGLYQLALVAISTAQDKPDAFSISGNVNMIAGDPSAQEALVFNLDQIDFNPLTRQISLKGSNSDVYFVGRLVSGSIVGDWYSKLFGKMGSMVLKKNAMPEIPPNLAQLSPIKGTYYGTFRDTHGDTRLPSRIMLTLVPFNDVEKPGGLGVSGNIRFYYGSYSSSEYRELPFKHLEYNFLTRNLSAKTDEDYMIFTIEGGINQGTIAGTISDDAFGRVGTFSASPSLPADPAFSMGGDYTGFFSWDQMTAFQTGTLNIVPTFSGEDSLKLAATAKLVFGDFLTGEQLVYRLDETEFNPTTGLAIFKSRDSEVTLKGFLEEGTFAGEWFTTIHGRMGRVALSKIATPEQPQGAPMNSLRGTYQGRLRNTSPDANLPERIMVGLVTSPDLSSPRGIRVTGNVRLYIGPFGSDEYTELALEEIQFDFYTRKLAGKTRGELRLTLKGDVGTDKIEGHLFHDSLGEVAQFEVARP